MAVKDVDAVPLRPVAESITTPDTVGVTDTEAIPEPLVRTMHGEEGHWFSFAPAPAATNEITSPTIGV